jgi:predicted nucleic acid-binding protein
MIFTDIPACASIFVDGNVFIFYFSQHPLLGPPCKQLLERVENQEIDGFTSAHVLGDVAHRLMTLEAQMLFSWPAAGIVRRLRRHPTEVQQLRQYRQAIDEIPIFGIHILPITGGLISLAADVTRQTGLLAGDALIVAAMRDNGVTNLASLDADFDRVPALTRFVPV